MKTNGNKRLSKASLRKNRQVFGIFMMFLSVALLLVFVWRINVIAFGRPDGQNLKQRRLATLNETVYTPAERGAIVDRDGSVLADSGTNYKVYALIKHQYAGDKRKTVKNKVETADTLSKYLKMSSEDILKRLTPSNRKTTQVEFGQAGDNLSLATKKALKATKIPGLFFQDSSARRYPNGIFASHALGMVSTMPDNQTGTKKIIGKMGLEQEFNTVLSGQNGVKREQKDGFGFQLAGTKASVTPVKDGGTVYTTLDTNLQSYLETLMDSVQSKYVPLELTATVMNPKTGAILATAERPTFDPVSGTGLNKWSSALYQDVYEPGSIMKIMTLASAIDSGNYHPNEMYQSGHVTLGGGTIYDWQKSGWGTVPVGEAFPRSSNTGMVHIEQTMGGATWHKYLKRFGFGQRTGITLPQEGYGHISFNGTLNQASTAFGQAINVTQVQMLQAMSAIANNGQMVRPRIVSKTINDDGTVRNYGTENLGRVIKKSSAEGVRQAMTQVINAEYGTGRVYKIPGIDLGVKTGTAQVAGKHGYLSGAWNYTFSVAGMVPINKPKYIVYITMRQPQKMTEDPEKILNSIFTPLVKRTVALGGLHGVSGKITEMPNVTGQSLNTAISTLEAQQQRVAVIGSGNKVVQQLPANGQQVMGGSRAIVLTNGAMTMPSVIGWGKSDVLKLAQITGVPFTFKGEGFASQQTLKPGSLLTGSGGTIKFTDK
ncbi:penicillin-binding transpeptidase domain-containing protein [Lacticaseibacillus pabuli]|uniref:Penicillin-binding transpeptidase domain-containing protein n=1 Tax=Lacticaseibacillus pabuli TaxID=3025672 RepID=A0ABY7WNA8_9LACO|nr:penicillin-binding transpeptidase domain-containing protein [Lacticaseibacillus sp. KACC 23028]WDF81675.1 penicillin-binding transpeptidase domain-containing protein [Lacticaseibacillus sp. KACC 23028]